MSPNDDHPRPGWSTEGSPPGPDKLRKALSLFTCENHMLRIHFLCFCELLPTDGFSSFLALCCTDVSTALILRAECI